MRFHHMIQHIIGRIEESDTSQRKECHSGEAAGTGSTAYLVE